MMQDYSGICYVNTFLSQVIIRIDFLQYLQSEAIFNADIEKEILSIYPKRAPDQLIRFNSINVTFDNAAQTPNAQGHVIDGIQREYRTTSGNNKTILSNKFIVFEINQYTSYAEHMAGIKNILPKLYSRNNITAVRVGIRFINIYNSEKTKIQKNFFSPEIAASIISPGKTDLQSKAQLIRSMHMSEYDVNTMRLNFRYGMYNPSFPDILRKNDFVLDFDCYTEDATDSLEEVLQHIDMGHQAIQSLFESSITDALRKVMQSD